MENKEMIERLRIHINKLEDEKKTIESCISVLSSQIKIMEIQDLIKENEKNRGN